MVKVSFVSSKAKAGANLKVVCQDRKVRNRPLTYKALKVLAGMKNQFVYVLATDEKHRKRKATLEAMKVYDEQFPKSERNAFPRDMIQEMLPSIEVEIGSDGSIIAIKKNGKELVAREDYYETVLDAEQRHRAALESQGYYRGPGVDISQSYLEALGKMMTKVDGLCVNASKIFPALLTSFGDEDDDEDDEEEEDNDNESETEGVKDDDDDEEDEEDEEEDDGEDDEEEDQESTPPQNRKRQADKPIDYSALYAESMSTDNVLQVLRARTDVGSTLAVKTLVMSGEMLWKQQLRHQEEIQQEQQSLSSSLEMELMEVERRAALEKAEVRKRHQPTIDEGLRRVREKHEKENSEIQDVMLSTVQRHLPFVTSLDFSNLQSIVDESEASFTTISSHRGKKKKQN